MKAKDLRNSILQMAVRGKLVPQDPTDEPASVLVVQPYRGGGNVDSYSQRGNGGSSSARFLF